MYCIFNKIKTGPRSDVILKWIKSTLLGPIRSVSHLLLSPTENHLYNIKVKHLIRGLNKADVVELKGKKEQELFILNKKELNIYCQ